MDEHNADVRIKKVKEIEKIDALGRQDRYRANADREEEKTQKEKEQMRIGKGLTIYKNWQKMRKIAHTRIQKKWLMIREKEQNMRISWAEGNLIKFSNLLLFQLNYLDFYI